MARQSSSLKSFIYKDECYFYSKKRIKTLRLRFKKGVNLFLVFLIFAPLKVFMSF